MTKILFHLMADTGCLPDKVIPQIPTNWISGEDRKTPRICTGYTLDDCLTGIGIPHFISSFLLTEIRQGRSAKLAAEAMLLPFVGRVYCVEDNNPALILDDVTRHFVYDATITRECWLTEYIEPVKTEKLWLVDGEIRLVPFSQDGKQYEYPVVLNSKWSSIPMQPAPEFRKCLLDVTKKWLDEEPDSENVS